MTCLEVILSPKNTLAWKIDNRDEGAKREGRERADSAHENAIFPRACTLLRKYSILKHTTKHKWEYTNIKKCTLL